MAHLSVVSLYRLICSLGPSLPHRINLSLEFYIRVRWRNHPGHLSIPIQSLILRCIVAVETWFELDWQFYRAQISLCFNYGAFPLIIVVPARYLGIERFDVYSPGVAKYLLSCALI